MNNQLAKKLVDQVFEEITASDSVNRLIEIEAQLFKLKERINLELYPKIGFQMSYKDIELLVKEGVLTKDYQLRQPSDKDTPLVKLLYSLIWKNGDLKKISHIIRGIHQVDDTVLDQDKGFVFYQFGKYLTGEIGQPIIDQHVLRAYAVYDEKEISEIERLRRMGTVSKKEKPLIQNYIDWLKSKDLSSALRSDANYVYYIDRILFATGKKIKLSKNQAG